MNFRYTTRILEELLDYCLIITDNSTLKNIKLTRTQAEYILKGYALGEFYGEFPHATYSIDNKVIDIYHYKDTENHNISIEVLDLLSILKENKGVV